MDQTGNAEPRGRNDVTPVDNRKPDDVMSLSSVAERMYQYY